MHKRTWFVLGILAGVAVCAAAGLPGMRRQRDWRFGRGHSAMLVPVIVFAQDVPAGTTITFDRISQRSMPEQFVTASMVKPDSASDVVNQRLLVDLKAGDVVRWGDFGVDRLAVKPKTRAFTLSVPPERMVSGQLSRGDHVDVLVTLTDPRVHQKVARTLLQNVAVLGVTPGGAILQVGEEEAEALLLSQEVGTFALALRSPQDAAVMAASGRTTIDTLLSGERAHSSGCGPSRPIQIIRSAPQ